ncbi:tetratricopeptide repeat protein [Microbacterium sp. Leaf179]|uniref:tetratricopeptide repeat protein n=1 Tax=Microbacterium sp. Leaf179 TaxID=1736288 RepID=UPI000B2731AA|nr:tetratricopeptide repeat protein [Microbacterium sp. Leaf179]
MGIVADFFRVGWDYESFVRRVRSGELPRVGRVITDSGISLHDDFVRELRVADDVPTALYLLGAHMWAESGGELEAIGVFEAAVARGSVEATRALGMSLNWMGLHERAVDVLARAIEDDPEDAELHGLLGLSMSQQMLDDSAEPHLRLGLSRDPSLAIPLAEIRRRAGDEREYRELVLEAARCDVYGSHIIAGNYFAENNDVESAEKMYRSGIASGDAHSAYNLGRLFYSSG